MFRGTGMGDQLVTCTSLGSDMQLLATLLSPQKTSLLHFGPWFSDDDTSKAIKSASV